MDDLIAAINDHGARAVRVFPPISHVVLFFSEKIATEVVGLLHGNFFLHSDVKWHRLVIISARCYPMPVKSLSQHI